MYFLMDMLMINGGSVITIVARSCLVFLIRVALNAEWRKADLRCFFLLIRSKTYFTGSSIKMLLEIDVIAGSPFLMDLNGSVIGDIFGELPININYVSLINETSDPGYIDIMGFMNSFLNFSETGTGRDDICATPDTDGNNFNGGDGIIAAWNQSLKGLVNNTREIKRNGKSHLDETKDLTGILDALNIPVLSIKVHCPVDLEIVRP